MTSYEHHTDIVKFFRENLFFGGDESSFVFFPQPILPALTKEGKIMMSSKGKIVMQPNGGGAFLEALSNDKSF